MKSLLTLIAHYSFLNSCICCPFCFFFFLMDRIEFSFSEHFGNNKSVSSFKFFSNSLWKEMLWVSRIFLLRSRLEIALLSCRKCLWALSLFVPVKEARGNLEVDSKPILDRYWKINQLVLMIILADCGLSIAIKRCWAPSLSTLKEFNEWHWVLSPKHPGPKWLQLTWPLLRKGILRSNTQINRSSLSSNKISLDK